MEFELPKEFEYKMKKLLGEEWDSFLKSYQNNNYHGLRFNLQKLSSSDDIEYISDKLGINENGNEIPWEKTGIYYSNESRPGKHPYHEMGLYYIQEPSAMSAAALLKPEPGMKVLDLCAAPGGKSTQLANMIMGEGLLVCNEINSARCKILSQNIERMGIRNAIVTNEDSFKLAEKFPGFFDAILVDAPCSGEGMFRKNVEAIGEWSENNVLKCAGMQKEILDNAAKMLAPGGRMVFSTCTFSPEENEENVEFFLKGHDDFEIEDVDTPWFSEGKPEWTKNNTKEVEKSKRLWPHKLKGEGHFVAVFRKKGNLSLDRCETGKAKKKNSIKDVLSKEERKIFDEFIAQTCTDSIAKWISSGVMAKFGSMLYRLPDNCPNLSGLHVLRSGLCLGEFKKNRFEPSHSLAVSMKKEDACNCINLSIDDDRTYGYFRGESIILSDDDGDFKKKGWCLVLVDGFSAGWGKISGMQVKNHYPKGLRRELK